MGWIGCEACGCEGVRCGVWGGLAVGCGVDWL